MRIVQSLRHAARRLLRTPSFSIVCVLTIAMAAAAFATAFSIAKALFVDPLPYRNAERIVVLSGEMRGEEVQEWPLGVLDLRDLREMQDSLRGPVPVAGGRGVTVVIGGTSRHLDGELVGHGYFEIFGLAPAAGRFFSREEELTPSTQVAVLSHELWMSAFGGTTTVIGQPLAVNERSFEIIGVAPAGFHGLYDGAEIWLPVSSAATLYQPGYLDVREFRWVAGIGSLAEGASIESAGAALESSLGILEKTYPKEYENFHVVLQPAETYLLGDLQGPASMLLVAALLVLCVACLNLTNLLLARNLARQKDASVQAALGARWFHLFGERASELLWITLAGGLLGASLAALLLPSLLELAALEIPRFVTPAIDANVLLATVGASYLMGCVLSLVPAWIGSVADPARSVRDPGTTTGSVRKRHLQSILIILETAMAVILITATGLLLRGLSRYLETDLGFTATGLTATRLNMASERYLDDDRYHTFVAELLERASAAPGVSAAAIEGPGFPTFGGYGLHLWNDNASGGPVDVITHKHLVTPGYFEALGIELLQGREFTHADRGEAGNAIILSRSLAELLWPGENALGRKVRTSRGTEIIFIVVGIVDDVRHQGLSVTTFTAPHTYVPLLKFPSRTPPAMNLLTRSTLPLEAQAEDLRGLLADLDPHVPPIEIVSVEQELREQTSRDRLLIALMTTFALTVLVLAAAGIYGVVTYAVEQSARDISIRMALGADARMVVRDLLLRAILLTLVGVLAGLAVIPAVGKLAIEHLYGIDPLDPVTLGTTIVILISVAIVATLIPARRATAIDPLTNLKSV